MTESVQLDYRSAPFAPRYLAGVLWPKHATEAAVAVPRIGARWRGYRATERDVADFCRLAGVWPGEWVPFLFPHAIGFRLQLALLCHPRFPAPIWRMLQIRNHLVQHRPIPLGADLHFASRIVAHRVLEKGLEVDVHSTVSLAGDVPWESVNTFYSRGSFGTPMQASPLAESPTIESECETRWRMAEGGGWRFGELTGDYNPLHFWSGHARRRGFPGAFHHTQRALGLCITHPNAPLADEPQRLDAWLKGPVPYGADVTLRTRAPTGEVAFALTTHHDPRPAIVGLLRYAEPSERLPEVG
ncbi:MAG: acyl dehydratase [Burkholderiales bacterium]|nr:acyl dehydratase [Burkholderiales bacterium]